MNKYHEFFKYNVIVLRSKKFSEEGQNAPQLKKILDDVADFLEGKQTPTVVKTLQVRIASSRIFLIFLANVKCYAKSGPKSTNKAIY